MKRILTLILILLLSFTSFSKDEIRKVGLQKNDLFPEITLVSTDGKEKITSKDLQGKKTIYSFVTTWCTYCTKERPILNEFYIKNKDKLNVVSIFIAENSETIEKYVEKYPTEFKHYQDKDGALANSFYIRGTPTSYIVGENGVIKGRVSGMVNWNLLNIDTIGE
ncbi:MAG: TlpA family protein disulfide reductase [Fusobacteriaceae bacterium]